MPAQPEAHVSDSLFDEWLGAFGSALERQDLDAVVATVEEDGYWRDVLAFDLGFHTHEGRAAIKDGLAGAIAAAAPRAVRPTDTRARPRLVRRSGRRMVEAYFEFDTELGTVDGFVRLPLPEHSDDGPRAWIVLTMLRELRGFEERIGDRRPSGHEYSETFGGPNWLDKRASDQAYTDRDPDVLIIGAGQSGLVLGARLRQIGVDTLIVERNTRVGDNWRHRYHSLTLHNEVTTNHLPYLLFPPNFPTFLPKDKLAGWLESYAEAMELNIWTGTEFVSGEFDEAEDRWSVRVRQGADQVRQLRPKHLVLATGTVSGIPNVPQLPGLERFAGEVVHSSAFSDGLRYRGRRALVVGTGNSGHDVAQELHGSGAARVTMAQRSPTCVVSLDPCGLMVYSLYSEGPDVEDIDLITASMPYPVIRDSYQGMTRKTCEIDADLLTGLSAVGFETDFEPDGTGFHMKYMRRGGGYYINVGCSELIVDGQIGVLQMRDVQTFTESGVLMRDGSEHPLDLIVLATGYENQQASVRRFLGDDVADRVGPIWGFSDQGFMRNVWTRTRQRNFWIMGGALAEARLWSRPLALQLKADLEGLVLGKSVGGEPR